MKTPFDVVMIIEVKDRASHHKMVRYLGFSRETLNKECINFGQILVERENYGYLQ